MRRFTADASHELRTPLTCVRGLAEYGMQQGTAASPEELLRLLSLIGREADRMGRLVADLLLLARFDAGRPLDRRPMDLASGWRRSSTTCSATPSSTPRADRR